MKKRLKKIAALLFSALFIMQGFPVTAFAADDPDLANWSVHLDFVDPEDDQNLTDDYLLEVTDFTSKEKEIKLQVTIQYTGDGSVTYAPGDVSFSLQDIRDILYAYQGFAYEYDIAAELKGSDSGRGDWYYEVKKTASNSKVDYNEFLFTNKDTISGAFTSTFQIIMKPEVRYAPPNYTKTFQTELSFQNITGSVSSNEATFTYKGSKTSYSPITKYEPLTDGSTYTILGKIPEGKTTDDYIFANVYVGAPCVSDNISSIYHSYLRAAFPDDVLVSEDCTVDSSNSGIFANAGMYCSLDSSNVFHAYGIYSNGAPLRPKDAYSLSFVVAFPRDKYIALGTYTQTFELLGKYYAEKDEFKLLNTFNLTFNFADFQYKWKPGALYSQAKSGYAFRDASIYEDHYDYNYVYDNIAYAYSHPEYADSDNFTIDSTAIYTGKPYDLIIGDDLQYFLYDDNTYRKLADDERIVDKVYIESLAGGNTVEVYGRAPGSTDYELYTTLTSYTSSQTVTFDKTYCEIKIKYLDVTESVVDLRTNIFFTIFDNVSLDNGKKPFKVYNFAYLDISIDDTFIDFRDDRADVVTNITGLADDIDAHDTSLYNHIPYRSVGFKSVLPSEIGVHQTIGHGIVYNNRTQVTDNRVYICTTYVPKFYDYQGGGHTWCDFTDKIILPAGWDMDLENMYFSINSNFKLENGDTVYPTTAVSYSEMQEALRSEITMEKTTLSDGRVCITIHYDFKNNRIINTDSSSAFITPVVSMHMDRDTYEMLKMNGKKVTVEITRSINQDSNDVVYTYTSRTMKNTYTCPSIAYSTYQGVSIESSVNGGDFDKTDKTISCGENYEYKLRFATSSSKVKNLVFYDLLDGSYGSEEHWQGTFQGVDTSALAALGITPDIYYSTSASQSSDLTASGWVKSTDYSGDLDKVKAVAISLGENVIDPGSMIFVKIKMKATEDTTLSGKSAYNSTSVSYKAYDASLTVLTDDNASENIKDLASNVTKITLAGNQRIHITYEPNGAIGLPVTDTINAGDEYIIRDNIFERDGYTFIGWDTDKDRADDAAQFQPDVHITDPLSEFNISEPANDNYVKLYAIWDKNPEISEDAISFYEGEKVTKDDLLKDITAIDEEDGDLTSDMRITDLTYSEGKIVDGVKTTEKETVVWESDMPSDYLLDTWFMQLDKEDSPVTHKATYTVTDSAGETTTFERSINVIYNEPPEISGKTKYFFSLEEAQNGKITKKALLDDLLDEGTLVVTDKEDDQWYPGTLQDKLVLLDYDADSFTDLEGPAYVTLHYLVIDSLVDILPRLKPWDSLDSGGITRPYRPGYSRRHSGSVPMGVHMLYATFRAEG